MAQEASVPEYDVEMGDLRKAAAVENTAYVRKVAHEGLA